MIIKYFFSVLFVCLFSFSVAAAELSISADKSVLSEGDILYLTIDYNGDDSGKPDLSTLANDFQVVSNSTSRYIQYVNGNVSQVKSWRIGLKPLTTGKITIKPIKIGNLVSNYLDVEVKEVTNVAYVPDSRENSNAPYFQIEQKISNEKPYVQQQVTLLVTIYDSIGLQDGSLNVSESSKNDWILTSLSQKPMVHQEVINNKKMNVIQFAFAAFPQKSGELEIPQFIFEGYYLKNTGFDFPDFQNSLMMFGVDFKNAFGQKVPVNMKTNPQKVTVLPALAVAAGQSWLPLSNLEISSKWQNNTTLKTGDALRREITLVATGLPQSMIPNLNFQDVSGLKQYPEKPEITETVVNGKIVSTAKINNVYIPTEAGNFVLPALKINWFNVQTGEFEQAILPEETIDVMPNPDVPSAEVEAPVIQPQPQTQDKTTSDLMPEKKKEVSFNMDYKLTGIVLLGVVILLLIIRYAATLKHKNSFRNNVIHFIQKHDYPAAKTALIAWGRHKFNQPEINNFNMIAALIRDENFKQELSYLNKLLYSGSNQVFDSAKFIKAFKNVDKIKFKSYKDNKVLPNLYD